jgi:hypothetical protein
MPDENRPELKPWELAEAEAASDVTDADVRRPPFGAATAVRVVPARVSATDTELAHAECESDLSHSEPARWHLSVPDEPAKRRGRLRPR